MFDLDVDEQAAVVSFDRHKTNSINLEESSIPVKKSEHLVLSKNNKSLGEVAHAHAHAHAHMHKFTFCHLQVVNGGPLPPRYHHTPISSFAVGGHSPHVTEVEQESVDGGSVPSYSHQDLTTAMETLVHEEVVSTCAELARQCITEVSVHAVSCHTSER